MQIPEYLIQREEKSIRVTERLLLQAIKLSKISDVQSWISKRTLVLVDTLDGPEALQGLHSVLLTKSWVRNRLHCNWDRSDFHSDRIALKSPEMKPRTLWARSTPVAGRGARNSRISRKWILFKRPLSK